MYIKFGFKMGISQLITVNMHTEAEGLTDNVDRMSEWQESKRVIQNAATMKQRQRKRQELC